MCQSNYKYKKGGFTLVSHAAEPRLLLSFSMLLLGMLDSHPRRLNHETHWQSAKFIMAQSIGG